MKRTLPAPQPLITLNNVSIFRGDNAVLNGIDWRINVGESWAVIGANGSGKSTLAAGIAGEAATTGEIEYAYDIDGDEPTARIASVSFYLHRLFVAQSDGYYQSRWYLGEEESTLTGRQVLNVSASRSGAGKQFVARIANIMGITRLLDRQTLHLSTGEMRRLLIARALTLSPILLILDEPFIGLDVAGRAMLSKIIEDLIRGGQQIVFMTARPWELPSGFTHQLILGAPPAVPKKSKRQKTEKSTRSASRKSNSSPVVELKDVNLNAGRVTILKNIDWLVRAGERWAVVGPNGSGKTTLMSLISGDHPQAYAQDVRLFGQTRDEGPTIWELKAKIGLASPDIALHYDTMTTTHDFICTGFFETLGLYRTASSAQQAAARKWASYFGLSTRSHEPFRLLSDGQQRLAVLARAFVKSRKLLVLDEPCQGLDAVSRQKVLRAIDSICGDGKTTLVIVTHYSEELPKCITHRLELGEHRIKYCGT